MRRQLVRAITIDPLTGLPTRHELITAFEQHMAHARRTGSALCVALIDIDGLKAINDSHGHHAGDRVLAESARAWRAAFSTRSTASTSA